MRGLSLYLVLLLVLPAAGGQAGEDGVRRILDDPANDLVFADTTPVPVPRGSMDLRYLEVEETEDSIRFRIGTQPDTGHSDQGEILVWMRHNDAEFRLTLQQRNLVSGWYWVSFLHRVEPDGFSFVSESRISEPVPADRSAGWVMQEIPRVDLADRSGALPYAGRMLEDIWVESQGWFTDVPLRDRMPETGSAEPVELRLGPQQDGDIELWSASPGRASNGEATTLIYEVTARNKGEATLLEFEAHDVLPDWLVTFPAPLVELAAGATETYPVLVQVPFRHDHGSVASVNITLKSSEGDVGRTKLSVIYHAVPQPAGHHDTVWFHSDASPDATTPAIHASGLAVWHSLSMNALEEFDADDRVAVPATNRGPVQAWTLPLDPILQMGLDFDLQRTGTLSVPLRAATSIEGAVLAGELLLIWQDESGAPQSMTIATLDRTDPFDIAPRATVETVVRPMPDADLLPYREGANVVLDITLDRGEYAGFGPEKPELMPGGWMRLPLHEYHDPVDDIFRSLHGVVLKAEGPQQRLVNPGETVTFTARLEFDGPASSFDLRLQGRDAASAVLRTGPQAMAGGGQDALVTVAVAAPADAADGTFMDVVLVAHLAEDPVVQGLLRLVADVDTELDHPDEFVQQSASKESPGGLGLLALGFAVAACVRRRGS